MLSLEAIIILELVLLSVLCNGALLRWCWHDPYRDIQAPMPYAVSVPNTTFDSRGFA